MKTEDPELTALRELSADIAAAEASPWEPGTIARAWGTPDDDALAFTMQTWIDLDAVRSPLLQGRHPSGLAELEAAARCFGLDAEPLNGSEAAHLANAMVRTVVEGFEAALRMQPPEGDTAPAEQAGFGTWLPVLACLITQCGLRVAEARAITVAQAFTLIAAHRLNQGWTVAGVSYALREVEGRRAKDEGETEGEDRG